MDGQAVLIGKKMKDRRYKKTEEKILTVFFDEGFETMREIAKRAGVARSTIYAHHHSVMEILSDWETYILAEYQAYIRRRDYFEIVVFILKNRQFFEVFLKFGNRGIIIKMIFVAWEVEKPGKVLRIVASGIAEIIFEWGERGFSEKEIERVLLDITYLSGTMKNNLRMLCD